MRLIIYEPVTMMNSFRISTLHEDCDASVNCIDWAVMLDSEHEGHEWIMCDTESLTNSGPDYQDDENSLIMIDTILPLFSDCTETDTYNEHQSCVNPTTLECQASMSPSPLECQASMSPSPLEGHASMSPSPLNGHASMSPSPIEFQHSMSPTRHDDQCSMGQTRHDDQRSMGQTHYDGQRSMGQIYHDGECSRCQTHHDCQCSMGQTHHDGQADISMMRKIHRKWPDDSCLLAVTLKEHDDIKQESEDDDRSDTNSDFQVPVDDMRKEARKEQNRRASRKYRAKQRDEDVSLKQELMRERSLNVVLQTEVEELRNERQRLTCLLRTHLEEYHRAGV